MLKHILTASILAVATPVLAQNTNFEEGSEAKTWNRYAEYPVRSCRRMHRQLR